MNVPFFPWNVTYLLLKKKNIIVTVEKL